MKICTKCDIKKDFSDYYFYKNKYKAECKKCFLSRSKNKYKAECKKCFLSRSKDKLKRNEYMKIYMQEYRKQRTLGILNNKRLWIQH